MTVSGQYNFYKVPLNNSQSPLAHIKLHTNRVEPSGNFISLGIQQEFLNTEGLEWLSAYVNDKLRDLGAYLIKTEYGELNEAGAFIVTRVTPSHIKVPNYLDARRVVDALSAQKGITAEDRAAIELPLRELEKSTEYSARREDVISPAQKEIIEAIVSRYVETIKSAAPDIDTAKRWVKCIAGALATLGPDPLDPRIQERHILAELLNTAGLPTMRIPEGGTKREKAKLNKQNWESLFYLARCYANMGDLEKALKMGGELPKGELIQKTILDLFD